VRSPLGRARAPIIRPDHQSRQEEARSIGSLEVDLKGALFAAVSMLEGVGFEVCVSTFEMCAPSTSSTRAHLRDVVPLHLVPYYHLHTSHASSSADGYLVSSADDIQLVCESDERRAGARPLHVGLRAPGTARREKGFHRMQAEEPASFREVLAAWCASHESPAHA
jgi:hypothetical protein